MIISFNWLKKFIDINMPIDDFSKLVGERLVEVEEIIDLADKYKNILIVEAVSVSKIEGSDHLSLVLINDGNVSVGLDRNEDGLIQVVCGAPNIASGQKVIWLQPKTVVPETFGTNSQFVLESRKLRGYISNGMIASAKELDLYDDHEGILVVDNSIEAGTDFASYFELDDYLLDIENKSLTHRPDCFGIIGFAREVAGITGSKFVTPDYMSEFSMSDLDFGFKTDDLKVSILNNEVSSAFSAVILNLDVDDNETPLIIKTYLSRSGIRPISPIVDVTNYIMLLTGQPLHAFDYDKLLRISSSPCELNVRLARDGESLVLLDGNNIQLTDNDIVVCAGNDVISLAGAMGGLSTSIDSSTKRIVIESAAFNLYNLRNTQMRFGIFSEAITRFTKGQPAGLTIPALKTAIDMLKEVAGVDVRSDIVSTLSQEIDQIELVFDVKKINEILGSEYQEEFVKETLINVGFEFSNDSNSCNVRVPYWRTDIHSIEDISEEVGRLNGYDNIVPILPSRDFRAVKPVDFDLFRNKIRKNMTSIGMNEVLSYSFIHGDLLEKIGLKTEKSYRIINSISPSLQYYRQSLTPNLLSFAYNNTKQGFDEFAIYEINKIHSKDFGLDDENVPVEKNSIAAVYHSKKPTDGAAYYKMKTMLDLLFSRIGLNVYYDKKILNLNEALISPFESKRSASIINQADNKELGVIGEYRKTVLKSFKLSDYCSGFEIDLDALFLAVDTRMKYIPLSKYPSVERDLCFQIDSVKVNYVDIINSLSNSLSQIDLLFNIEPIDIYQQDGSTKKNITVRVKLTSSEKTLDSQYVNDLVQNLANNICEKLSAVLI